MEAASITYGELDERARALGARLQSEGAAGERVLLLYPPGLDYVVAFFGCLYAGAVAVPAYPPQSARNLSRLQAVASDARAAYALTTADICSRLEGGAADTAGLSGLRWLVTDGAEEAGRADDWREPPVTPETLAFLQYTSGSTGDPKGVMVSHGNVLHNSALIARGFGYTPSTECVTWLPLYHDMGLIGGVLQPLYGGFTNTLLSPLSFVRNPYGWLKAISTYKADLSGAPNFAYDLCARRVADGQRATLDLSGWEVAFVGAEPIRPATLERFAAAFAPCGFRRKAFLPCYGLAEATLIVSCGARGAGPSAHTADRSALEQHRVLDTDGEAVASLFSSCGRPLPPQEVVLVNPETRTLCRPDEVGEVWVSGPSVARGYWGRPEETAATMPSPWVPTSGSAKATATRR